MSNSSIWAIDRTLSGAASPYQSGPGSDKNEGVIHFTQSFVITVVSPLDRLWSDLGHSLGRVLPLCRNAFNPADWAIYK